MACMAAGRGDHTAGDPKDDGFWDIYEDDDRYGVTGGINPEWSDAFTGMLEFHDGTGWSLDPAGRRLMDRIIDGMPHMIPAPAMDALAAYWPDRPITLDDPTARRRACGWLDSLDEPGLDAYAHGPGNVTRLLIHDRLEPDTPILHGPRLERLITDDGMGALIADGKGDRLTIREAILIARNAGPDACDTLERSRDRLDDALAFARMRDRNGKD